jgi:hypothetical protein
MQKGPNKKAAKLEEDIDAEDMVMETDRRVHAP